MFRETSSQEDIYKATVLERFTEGYSATIFAYGQTSSGKTKTQGVKGDKKEGNNDKIC